ncbi:hypothetical protein EJ08DRAFT_664941 [Tothia fuscella]|uniref:Uncharacterized protein n=1 Tax=Tothia fuscella TaxID=1048955 RepID=A0A9P4TU74_9PEZI|nr:hypothetical protein EJ08DRAFT_664941 [Tothia fuscella]
MSQITKETLLSTGRTSRIKDAAPSSTESTSSQSNIKSTTQVQLHNTTPNTTSPFSASQTPFLDSGKFWHVFPSETSRPCQMTTTSFSTGDFAGLVAVAVNKRWTWSRALAIDDQCDMNTDEPLPEISRIPQLDQSNLQAYLKAQVLSTCHILVTAQGKCTYLSGVWIRGENVDLVLTVAHFGGTLPATAKVWATARVEPKITQRNAIECDCISVHLTTSEDFAIFRPRNGERPRHALPLDFLVSQDQLDFVSLPSPAVCIGYNSMPPTKHSCVESIFGCPCFECFALGANGVANAVRDNEEEKKKALKLEEEECRKLSHKYKSRVFHSPQDGPDNLALHEEFLRSQERVQELSDSLIELGEIETHSAPDLTLLNPNARTISTGFWQHPIGDGAWKHSVTGWHGISGAAMYSYHSKSETFKCVALYQGGYFCHPHSSGNKAIPFTSKILDELESFGS